MYFFNIRQDRLFIFGLNPIQTLNLSQTLILLNLGPTYNSLKHKSFTVKSCQQDKPDFTQSLSIDMI